MVEASGRLSKVMSSDHTMRPPMVCAKVPRYRDLSIDANLCVCGGGGCVWGWVCVGGCVCLCGVCVYIYTCPPMVCATVPRKKK
jgi:hypothetical protein